MSEPRPDSDESRSDVTLQNARGAQVGDHNRMFNLFFSLRSERQVLTAPIAADQLAQAIEAQWTSEAQRRRLDDPYPLPVSWRPAASELTSTWESVARLAKTGAGWPTLDTRSWARDEKSLGGSDADIVRCFESVPTRRLLILGERGAGKSVLLVRLALGLLKIRAPGAPVPVLFSLASWNPQDQSIDDWLSRRLCLSSPGLANPMPGTNPRRSIADTLLRAGLVLPLLDGLDEMPTDAGAMTVTAINDGLRPGQGVVVSSRTAHYSTLVHPVQDAPVKITGAAGIEIDELAPAQVLQYLEDSSGNAQTAARWRRAVSPTDSGPSTRLAAAMTTPLAASLLRTIYNPRPGETLAGAIPQPEELNDEERFPTLADVQSRLFDRYLPAEYRARAGDDAKKRQRLQRNLHTMEFLASDLENRQGGASDLAWWEIRGAAPAALPGVFTGGIACIAGSLTIPWRGWGLGLIVAVLVGLSLRNCIPVGRAGLAAGLAGGVLGGEVAAIVALWIFGPGPGNAFLTSFIAGGVAVGIAAAPFGSSRLARIFRESSGSGSQGPRRAV